MFGNIVAEFATLVGFAALVSVIINVLKMFGVVKDGTADKWVAIFNLVGLIVLVVVRIFFPEFDVAGIDAKLAGLATVASYIISYIVMLLGSKLTYLAVKGLPVIGKSNTPPVG